MKAGGLSSQTMSFALRDALRLTQSRLQEANTEVSTGRHADMGLALGANTGRNLNWRVEVSRLDTMKTNNNMAASQADVTQQALGTLVQAASNFMSTLTGARNAQNGQAQAKQAAEHAMATFRDVLGTTYNGKYIFGGQNADQNPVNAYKGGTAEAAFDSAFSGAFGMAKTDPTVNSIIPADMKQFLGNSYDQLFSDANWKADWSKSSDINILAAIGKDRRVDMSANANEGAFRDMFKAMTAVMDAGTGKLGQATFETVVDFALQKIGNTSLGLGQIQSRIGLAQSETTKATDHINRQLQILQDQITKTEGVDPYDVATRVTQLTTQVETSYAVTGRISKLTLLNYI